ncbi:uncharacterized protein LOC112570002 [Pomacea canaliculata]|uniref:uncharacterized protein LOC112570002 n=1 Tax=Pomacea canaliculata TaxID=400727 RepID=UPI000D72AE5A|nr:uncharacterized protein LOC112570002 [Pomacea canaliculata]
MADQVMETTFLGVTDTGVVRKRSVKKRLTRDDDQSQRTYGQAKEDYHQLALRVLGERTVVNNIEVLQERWRMIMFMYDDCLQLIQQCDDRRGRLSRQRRRKRLLLLVVVSLVLSLVVSFSAWWVARRFL